MARRKKTSPAEDLIDLVALMPWWAGVLLAILGYFWLHSVASQPITANVQSLASSGFILGVWWRGLATAGQYVVPIISLAGAGVSAFRLKQRSDLVTDVAARVKGVVASVMQLKVGDFDS